VQRTGTALTTFDAKRRGGRPHTRRAGIGTMTRAPIAALWDSVVVWRRATAVLATLSLAFLVAAVISRDPPDFSAMPVIAVVRDREQHPIWAIRLARAAHQIAADSLLMVPSPPGHAYQLWLLVPQAARPRQIGLLPQSGRKRIAVSPENARLLTGAGDFLVTVEPPGGSADATPSGPVVFRGVLEGAG
jgi:anti-sigma-K factor RskA